jgi:hypothetical protein
MVPSYFPGVVRLGQRHAPSGQSYKCTTPSFDLTLL